MEIDGKRIKPENTKENFYKLILKNIELKNEKKEINCIIVDNVELKFLIKIISKYQRKKSNTVYKKSEQEVSKRTRGYSLPSTSQSGESIKDKIKIFSGEFIKKQINKVKVIPGKLKVPSLFQKEKRNSSENKSKDVWKIK